MKHLSPIWSLIGGRPVYPESDLRRWARPLGQRRTRRHGAMVSQNNGCAGTIEEQPARGFHQRRRLSTPISKRRVRMSSRSTTKTTAVGELVYRLMAAERRVKSTPPKRIDALIAEEQFLIDQILAAQPETVGDMAPMLMHAIGDCAEYFNLAAEDSGDERMIRRAKQLSVALAAMLRFVSAKARVDLRKLGADIFLDQVEAFPEFTDTAAAKAA